MDLKDIEQEVERLAQRLKEMLDRPRACTSPPWKKQLDAIDAQKIMRLGKKKA